MQQVEGIEDQAVRIACDRSPERAEVGQPVLILYDDLAVNDRPIERQFSGCTEDEGILPRPIMPIAREGAASLLINDKLRAVAVIFDLMQPTFTIGWFINERRQQRRNEGEP